MYKDKSILPTSDVTFKQIFWNKEYPNVLISFINSILKRDNPITSVDLIGTEHDSVVEQQYNVAEQMDNVFIGKHGIRLDLVGETSNNEVLNTVLRKQGDSLTKESKLQKRNNSVLREQIVDSLYILYILIL